MVCPFGSLIAGSWRELVRWAPWLMLSLIPGQVLLLVVALLLLAVQLAILFGHNRT